MGLIDRDYMHKQRSGPAFTPAPEKSAISTLFMVLVFVAALFLLYRLAGWQLAERTNTRAAASITLPSSTPRQASTRDEALPEAMPPTVTPHTQYPAPEPSTGHRIVTKCIVNGKTSYGDGPCTSGAVAAQVTTRADHNILVPVRATATAQPEALSSPAPVVIAQNPAPSDYAAKKLECEWLDAHIRQLDSMSRQPQGAQMMDWIRDKRKKARDQQFRIPCQ